VTRRQASTEAASRDLGFTADVDLAEGLRELVAWWRAERALDEAEAQLIGSAP
jgi:UDP-glucose 4-epimerase